MRILDFEDDFESAHDPAATSVTQSISNNVSATSISGFILDPNTYRGYVACADIFRQTGSSERRSYHEWAFVYDFTAVGWAIVMDNQWNTGVMDGVTLSMATNQVKYATDDHAGASYTGAMLWQIIRRFS